MVLDAEKRTRLAGVLSIRGNAPAGGAGTSTQPAPTACPSTSPISPIQTTQTPASPQPNPQPTSPQTTQNPLPSHTTPIHTSPNPIAVIPLATVRTSPLPAPLEKNKGVVIVPSDEKEDSVEGPVFKTRRIITVAASHSSSDKHAESLRDHPPPAPLHLQTTLPLRRELRPLQSPPLHLLLSFPGLYNTF